MKKLFLRTIKLIILLLLVFKISNVKAQTCGIPGFPDCDPGSGGSGGTTSKITIAPIPDVLYTPNPSLVPISFQVNATHADGLPLTYKVIPTPYFTYPVYQGRGGEVIYTTTIGMRINPTTGVFNAELIDISGANFLQKVTIEVTDGTEKQRIEVIMKANGCGSGGEPDCTLPLPIGNSFYRFVTPLCGIPGTPSCDITTPTCGVPGTPPCGGNSTNLRWVTIQDKFVAQNDSIAFNIPAIDDNASIINYSLVSGLPGMRLDPQTGLFTWRATNVAFGDYFIDVAARINVTQTDIFKTIKITVYDPANPPNIPPTLAAISNKLVTEGRTLKFYALATDDRPSTLRYSLDATSLSNGMQIDSLTGLFLWRGRYPNNTISFKTVTITVTDGQYNHSQTFRISFDSTYFNPNSCGLPGTPDCRRPPTCGVPGTPDCQPNGTAEAPSLPAPKLNSIANQTLTATNSLSLTLSTQNTPNAAINQKFYYSLDLASFGKGIEVADSTGALRWTPNRNQVGTHTIKYYAFDNGSFTPSTSNISQVDSLTFTITVSPAPSQRFYVKPVASGTGDGSSWVNASSDLQSLINNAFENDQIWVAAGTYLPSKNTKGNNPANAREKTFSLKGSINLYGGFAGTETALVQRNYSNNITILSGDLNGNDGANFTNNSENAYHVVTAADITGRRLLDGFTVTGGNANLTTGLNSLGAGIFMSDTTNGYLEIRNCIISNNSANGQGGGVYTGNLTFSARNVVFANNKSINEKGGGAYFKGVSTDGFPIDLKNCVFYGNSAQYGGAIYNDANARLNITNSTLVNNTALIEAGAVDVRNPNADFYSSIFYGNNAPNSPNIYNFLSQAISLNNNIIQTISGPSNDVNSSNQFNIDPLFVNLNNPKGADGIWLTADDGLQLQNTSPAIDAGFFNNFSDDKDILGNQFYNITRDIGAYENQIGNSIYNGTDNCFTVTLNNVSGFKWYYFRHNNTIIAAINPNNVDLGNVTLNIGDPSGTLTFDGQNFLGRRTSLTSSNYLNGAIMPDNYSLRLYFNESELSELQTFLNSLIGINDLNISWYSSSDCQFPTVPTNNGLIPANNTQKGNYGENNSGFFIQFDLDHFTVFAVGATPTTLPIRLLSFDGKTQNQQNLISWSTAKEEQNEIFELQHRNDYSNFNTINTQKSKGNSSGIGFYQFIDDKPFTGNNYYRLKVTDASGISFLSAIKVIKNDIELQVYPNPASTVLFINLINRSQKIDITNSLGLLIYHADYVPQQIDLKTFTKGIYFIYLAGQVAKVIIN